MSEPQSEPVTAWKSGDRAVITGLDPELGIRLNGTVAVVVETRPGSITIVESEGTRIDVGPAQLQTVQHRIREIQRDPNLAGADKMKAIQGLHAAPKAPRRGLATEDALPSPPKSASLAPKCAHYETQCVIVSACCDQVFQCRVCHDDALPDHKIDRFATAQVICKACDLLQPASNQCTSCEIQFSEYYCGICKLWKAEDSRGTYHCEDCGICRVGKRKDYFHCDTCEACLPSASKDDHVCLSEKYKSDCPVCRVDLFSSREGVQTMPCGHPIHPSCLKRLFCSGTFPRCPLCKRSAMDLSAAWEEMQQSIDLQPMPPPSESGAPEFVTINCNDCGETGGSPFHFIGCRCSNCGSFNTAIVGSGGAEDEEEEEEGERRASVGGGGGGGGGGDASDGVDGEAAGVTTGATALP